MSTMDDLRAGFVGLGTIGKPMTLQLAHADGIELWVHDIAAEPVAELAAAGAKAAASVAEMAVEVDVLGVMVRDDDQVRAVIAEVLGAVGNRTREHPLTVLVHSTVAPGTPAELAASAEPHGVHVLDAPVSGGPMGAAEGTLAILVGGPIEGYAAAAPVLAAMGTRVVHAGPVGAGTRLKLARNLLHFASFTAATEAQRLAEAAGLDLVELGEVVRHTDAITGGPGAIMHRDTTAPIEETDFWHGVFGHVVALGEKDLGFAIELADELGVEVPLARLALERLASGLGLGARPPEDEKFADLPALRARGLRKMEEVYGFDMADGEGDFFRYTADHLFGDIWQRPGLTTRDRRLLLVGLLAGQGAADVLGIQIPAAYANGELSEDELREIVVFLSHYAGWPHGARINTVVEETIGKARREARRKAREEAEGEAREGAQGKAQRS
ncbi:3-hydroxyisobutyrate dehydrogenase-like beta-hydroxyacid dehydrogenase/alkylhydroperoxidase/carboxymuconolactone decarboxylase family protein YurZ [Nocardioides luteus]|nr:3-hydroxyisobutyrate dehydrogenase-like beta-hydroxyacid dehydrogenase/alkylhydroperoxidase/carboxymuconolactone decarboxylase family protein YurZ [Nocardioides luteus]